MGQPSLTFVPQNGVGITVVSHIAYGAHVLSAPPWNEFSIDYCLQPKYPWKNFLGNKFHDIRITCPRYNKGSPSETFSSLNSYKEVRWKTSSLDIHKTIENTVGWKWLQKCKYTRRIHGHSWELPRTQLVKPLDWWFWAKNCLIHSLFKESPLITNIIEVPMFDKLPINQVVFVAMPLDHSYTTNVTKLLSPLFCRES